MHVLESPRVDRAKILNVMEKGGILETSLIHILDYVMELFDSQGLGQDYYGYHNINHELEVAYVTLSAITGRPDQFSTADMRHLYAAALLHDFDPLKSMDKPHEKSVVQFIDGDSELLSILRKAGLDMNLIKILILRTTYPWRGKVMRDAMQHIRKCADSSNLDAVQTNHYMNLGWLLSISDRIGGYALGDFSYAMELAKKNAHALAWKPSIITQRSVAYFEDLLNNESGMCQIVLKSLPTDMRRNFFDTVLAFMNLRTVEISIHAEHTYGSLRLVPTIEMFDMRQDRAFVDSLKDIFYELPKPLQFGRERFEESVQDPDTILNTLRLNDRNGKVVGFAKGGILEGYELDPRICDINYGLHNTVFLEPLALRMGYWGLRGGRQMRNMFILQAQSKRYKHLTSFALRDVIEDRVSREEAEFVTKFDPERWDYYRINL